MPDEVPVVAAAAEVPKPARRVRSNRSTTPKAPADVPAQPRDEDVADATRSGTVVPNLKLSEVKKIYIEIRGDADELRTNLVESLNSSGVVAATNAGEADAALKITVSKTGEVQALLVNARGTVLWPKSGARRYSGEISKVVPEIVKDLLSEIRLARTGH